MKSSMILLACMFVLFAASIVPSIAGPLFVDNFDDNSTNPSFWSTVSGGSTTAVEANGRLEVTIGAGTTGSTFGAGYNSTRGLKGDFDIQVDYQLLTWPNRNGVRVGLVIGGWNVERVSRGLGETYGEEYSADYGIQVFPRLNTTDQSGTLRMVRTGATVSSYYYHNGSWVDILTRTVSSGDIGNMGLHAWSHDHTFGHQQVQIAFDNFIINSGQVVPPVPEPSSLFALLCGGGGLGGMIRRRKKSV